MRKALLLFISAALILALAGCGAKPAPEKLAVKGKDTVCILTKDNRFKNEVVQKVTQSLESKGYRVVRDTPGSAKYHPAADYGAVVFIAEYQAWHVPRNAKSYYSQNGKAVNIVFMVTAGDPDLKIRKPFDAVTSASKQKEVDRVSREILTRLEGILK